VRGENIKFWTDRWVIERTLAEKYLRLYNNLIHKIYIVLEMGKSTTNGTGV